MRILLVTQDFPPVSGGIQTYCHQLSTAFAQAGHSVEVVCPAAPGSEHCDHALSVRRIRIHSSFLFLPLLLKMPGLLRGREYDLILYGQWQCALWTLLHRKLARKHRHFSLVHGRELLTSVFLGWTRPLARRTLRGLNGAIPNSRPIAGMLRDLCGELPPATVIHPGVDVELFRPTPTHALRQELGLGQSPVVSMITRLVPRKNADLLMRAFDQVADEFSEAVLLIGGTGPEFTRLQELRENLPCRARIRLAGRLPSSRLTEYFNLGQVFVLPSRSEAKDVEGFGIVYLEAGACGVPVIGARSGGVPDAVQEGVTGLLAEPGDIGSLAQALRTLLADPERARAMGEAGRRRAVAEFTWGAVAQKFTAVFAK